VERASGKRKGALHPSRGNYRGRRRGGGLWRPKGPQHIHRHSYTRPCQGAHERPHSIYGQLGRGTGGRVRGRMRESQWSEGLNAAACSGRIHRRRPTARRRWGRGRARDERRLEVLSKSGNLFMPPVGSLRQPSRRVPNGNWSSREVKLHTTNPSSKKEAANFSRGNLVPQEGRQTCRWRVLRGRYGRFVGCAGLCRCRSRFRS